MTQLLFRAFGRKRSEESGHVGIEDELPPYWWRENSPIRSTTRGRREYLENKEEIENTIGLCLSGGGFRAALFHLGSLRRLNELGILSRVDRISAVSGGSILAAHLATALRGSWPRPGEVIEDWDKRIRDPFWEFSSNDIRTSALRFGPRSAAARLEQRIDRELTKGMLLSELPDKPSIGFGSTEMIYGRYWVTSRDFVGSSSTVLKDVKHGVNRLAGDWPVARAVAASACFPPVFMPVNVWRQVPSELRPPEKSLKRLYLTDGGLYDNLGYMGLWSRCGIVLVSDGGGVSKASHGNAIVGPGNGLSTLWRLFRYQGILETAGRQSQKALLISGLSSGFQKGAYWSIKTKTSHYGRSEDYGYPHDDVVDKSIVPIRTDLNKFSDPEQRILENHGYWLAAAAIDHHLAGSLPFDVPDVPIAVPNQQWIRQMDVNTALQRSHRRLRFLPW